MDYDKQINSEMNAPNRGHRHLVGGGDKQPCRGPRRRHGQPGDSSNSPSLTRWLALAALSIGFWYLSNSCSRVLYASESGMENGSAGGQETRQTTGFSLCGLVPVPADALAIPMRRRTAQASNGIQEPILAPRVWVKLPTTTRPSHFLARRQDVTTKPKPQIATMIRPAPPEQQQTTNPKPQIATRIIPVHGNTLQRTTTGAVAPLTTALPRINTAYHPQIATRIKPIVLTTGILVTTKKRPAIATRIVPVRGTSQRTRTTTTSVTSVTSTSRTFWTRTWVVSYIRSGLHF